MSRPVVLAAVLALLTGCGAGEDKKKGGDGAPPVPVKVQVVGRSTLKRTVVLSGNVRPESEVRLYSKVAGRVEELSVDTCAEVKKGQVVARIDRALLLAGLEQARAAVKVAEADLKAAEVALADAERDLKRTEDLYKQGASNEQARDKARAALDTAGAMKTVSASRIAQARAAVDAAQVGLDEAEIRATIDGTVTARFMDQGDFINPGQPLLAIQDLRTVKVLASVPQADLPLVRPGVTRATFTVEGIAMKFDARVTKVEPALDPGTLSTTIEVGFKNRPMLTIGGSEGSGKTCGWALVSGMNARVELEIEEHQDALAVPLEAVRNDSRKDFVFTLAPDGATVKRLDVELGLRDGGLVEVLAPPSLAGRRVVVQGASRLTDGSRVQLEGGEKAKGAAPASEKAK